MDLLPLLKEGGWGVAALAVSALVYVYRELRQREKELNAHVVTAMREQVDLLRTANDNQKQLLAALTSYEDSE